MSFLRWRPEDSVATPRGRALLVPILAAIFAGACVSVPRPEDDRPTRCAEARAAARAAIDRAPPRCTSDADCRPYQRHLLGCASFAPPDYSLGGLFEPLERACGPSSREPSCPFLIGACVEARCVGRAAPGSPSCADARASLASRLASEAGCEADADCEVAWETGRPLAVHTGWRDAAQREFRAAVEGCPDELGRWLPDRESLCRDRRCALGPGRGRPLPPGSSLPQARCQPLPQRMPHLPAVGMATLKFVVSPRGVPQAFAVAQGDLPPAALRFFADSIASCEWTPGTDGGGPAPIWVVMPIRWH